MRRTIEFCFDYISPYSYLASTQIRAIAARHSVEVEPVPVLIAAMFATPGSLGPGEIPVRRRYMFHDIWRLAKALNVEIEPPATHPFNPLVPLRATYSVDGERRWKFIDALFRAAWVEGRRIDEAPIVAEIAKDLGFDADAMFAAAASDEVKGKLRSATADVVQRGGFGVPTMLVDDQLFWGVDSLPLLERYLEGKATPSVEEIARWSAVAPSVTRKVGR